MPKECLRGRRTELYLEPVTLETLQGHIIVAVEGLSTTLGCDVEDCTYQCQVVEQGNGTVCPLPGEAGICLQALGVMCINPDFDV